MPRLTMPALAALLLLCGCDEAGRPDAPAGGASVAPPASAPGTLEPGFVSLFNGNDLTGWEGDAKTWRVEDHVIVGGLLTGNPRNEFLASTASYTDFDIKLEYKLTGTEGFINSGVQLRSQRSKQPVNEMIGYQADIGVGYTGSLYDESRRNKTIAKPDPAQIKRLEHLGDWNVYEVRAEGRHIVITLNGEVTVDYTEADAAIPQEGFFGLQIHGGAKSEARFRNLRIQRLPAAK